MERQVVSAEEGEYASKRARMKMTHAAVNECVSTFGWGRCHGDTRAVWAQIHTQDVETHAVVMYGVAEREGGSMEARTQRMPWVRSRST